MDANLFRIGTNWVNEIAAMAHKIKGQYDSSRMREFQDALEGRGFLLLKDAFQSFTWMDHGRIKVVGSTPQYYVVASASDGTYNLLRGLPIHACSISFMKKPEEEPILSIVKDTCRGDVFCADAEGVRVNGKPVKASGVENLADALLSIDPRDLNPKLKDAKVYRRLGAFSLEMAWLASGYIDSLVQVNPLDWAYVPAGLHLVRKAGGMATDSNGADIKFKLDVNTGTNLVASGNKVLHKEVLKALKQ